MSKWAYRKSEERKIIKAIRSNPPDVAFIKERVWMEGGLLSINVRRDAWLLLLGEDPYEIKVCPDYQEPYRDDRQIAVDIDRSFVHFTGYDEIDEETLKSYRKSLTRVIRALLIEDETLFYYQGYHDIVEFLLLLSGFDLNWVYTIMKKLTSTYLSDYMHEKMEEVGNILCLLYPILQKRAPELIPILQYPDNVPMIIIPWVITLFTHSLSSVYQVARLFDVMLLHPLMPLYCSAAVVFHFRSELLALKEKCQLYAALGKLSKKTLPLEKIIRDTQFFYTSVVPSELIFKGMRNGVFLPDTSMIVIYEKNVNATFRNVQSFHNMYQMIVHPGTNHHGHASTWVVSLAVLGVAITAMFQFSIS